MAVFQRKVLQKEDADRLPRVFFTCHPEDFKPYFGKIADDILKLHPCAVYYTPDMTDPISPQQLETDLERINLLVVPVTLKLLTTQNRTMEVDIPYARRIGIPILPIMTEPGLDKIYSRGDRFGSLQYLDACTADDTKITYMDALDKHLQEILPDSDQLSRIRNAFDARIFLSYRKTDRGHANTLMRLIHSYPEYRDVAIWFDEYLTPGEDFEKNIKKELDACSLFTLLVTPRILESGNYVISTELPLALKNKAERGIDILPVEMEQTDRDALRQLQIEHCVTPQNVDALRSYIDKLVHTPDDSPDHKYLIGLAYFSGIDVEINREQAVALIAQAAEAGIYEAITFLIRAYDHGRGVPQDYEKSLFWKEKLAQYAEQTYGLADMRTIHAMEIYFFGCKGLHKYSQALAAAERIRSLLQTHFPQMRSQLLQLDTNVAAIYHSQGHFDQALQLAQAVYEAFLLLPADQQDHTLQPLNTIGTIYFSQGDYRLSLRLAIDCYKHNLRKLGENCPSTLTELNNIAASYLALGDAVKAHAVAKAAYTLSKKHLGQTDYHTIFILSTLAKTTAAIEGPRKALPLEKTAFTLSQEVLGQNHPSTLEYLGNLATYCTDVGDHSTALALGKDAYRRSCDVLGKHHPDTLARYGNLADFYLNKGAAETALAIGKEVYQQKKTYPGIGIRDVILSLVNLMKYHYHNGQLKEVLDREAEAQSLCRQHLRPDDNVCMTLLRILSLAHCAKEHHEKALQLRKEIQKRICEKNGQPFTETADYLQDIAEITALTPGKQADARKLFKRASRLFSETEGDTSRNALYALNCYVAVSVQIGFCKNVLEEAEKAYSTCLQLFGKEDALTKHAFQNLLKIYDSTKNHEKARKLRSDTLLKKPLPPT